MRLTIESLSFINQLLMLKADRGHIHLLSQLIH